MAIIGMDIRHFRISIFVLQEISQADIFSCTPRRLRQSAAQSGLPLQQHPWRDDIPEVTNLRETPADATIDGHNCIGVSSGRRGPQATDPARQPSPLKVPLRNDAALRGKGVRRTLRTSEGFLLPSIRIGTQKERGR